MEPIFDLLSKQVAQALTRRDAARVMVKGLVGALLTGTGLRNLWGLTGSTLSSSQGTSSFCPDCGTCQVLNAQTGQLQPCSDPCMAQKICNAAQQAPDYVTLQSYLINSRSFQFQSYSALIVVDGSHKTTTLATNFIGTSDGQAAALGITKISAGKVLAGASEFLNLVPQFAYAVSDGNIEAILPYQFEQNFSFQDFTAGYREADAYTDDVKIVDSQCGAYLKQACRFAGGGFGRCLDAADDACIGLVETPPAFAVCFTAVAAACMAGPKICRQAINEVCACIGGQVPCGESHICSGTCPNGYTCSSGLCSTSVGPCGNNYCNPAEGEYCCGNTLCCSAKRNGPYCCECQQTGSFCCCLEEEPLCLGCAPNDCALDCQDS